MNILKQAKYPSSGRPLVIQYQHARRCIAACLHTPARTNQIVASALLALEQRRDDPSSSPLVRDDAERSLEIVNTFQRTVNALALGGISYDPPRNPSPPLAINGVEVSVWPDAIVRATARRSEIRVGEAFIRCTIGEGGDAAENRRAEANGHLATIAHMHTAQTLADLGTPHSPTSMVIDVSREIVVRGPPSVTRRVANIETACGMIAAIWPTV